MIAYLGNTDTKISTMDDFQNVYKAYAKAHQWIFILYYLANSFVVAALVEEIAKYFAFWSLEHPDFLEISSSNRRTRLQRSRESYGAAITVAMVAAATGFACCEDIGYVFSPSSTIQDGKSHSTK